MDPDISKTAALCLEMLAAELVMIKNEVKKKKQQTFFIVVSDLSFLFFFVNTILVC